MLLINAAYKDLDSSPVIHLPYLLNAMAYLGQKRIRPDERFQGAAKRLQSASLEQQSEFSPQLLRGDYSDLPDWIPVKDALALLTYCRDSFLYRRLVQEINGKTLVSIASDRRLSWYEAQFGELLTEKLEKVGEETGIQYEISHQHMLSDPSGCSKRRIVVDFLVSFWEVQAAGTRKLRQIVIEFDEQAHEGKVYRRNDESRDKWLKRYLPQYGLIRVKHREQASWLACLESSQRLASMESYYAHCLKLASTVRSREERVITKETLEAAYDVLQNDCHPALERPKQRFREMKGILERLGVPYGGDGPIRFQRRKYGM
ncbi:hypothetical protein ACF2G4_23430 (plasmid) [Pantoea sp. C3]|uniref:hypothetical protein n=1 Tax=Pantoea phytostimulans TaxID=2769024 RepID=UPI0038F74638